MDTVKAYLLTATLGISIGATKSRICRAREALAGAATAPRGEERGTRVSGGVIPA
jgi:hypothetical protein